MPEASSPSSPASPSFPRSTHRPGKVPPHGDEPLSPADLLPPVPARPLHPLFLPADDLLRGGTGTVLLVESDDAVRAVAARVLGEAGYAVRAAATAGEAVRLAEEKGPVHLLVADLSVPEVRGGQLARRVALRNPDLRTLYLSVYPPEVLYPPAALLAKPFGAAQLLCAARQALAGAHAVS
jgi:CheY-like chemotaxis protein